MSLGYPTGVFPFKCLGCELVADEVQFRPAMTAYHWNGEGKNPNADVPLCNPCFEDHRAYWRERWDEYYSMVM